MAVTGLLTRLAAKAPVPVFAAVGESGLRAVDRLSLTPGVEMVASPRHASMLLIAGSIRPEDQPELERLHDQLPHPRATLFWGGAPLFAGDVLDATEDPLPVLTDMHHALLSGMRPPNPTCCPTSRRTPGRGRATSARAARA